MHNDTRELNKCVVCQKVYTDDVRMVCSQCKSKTSK